MKISLIITVIIFLTGAGVFWYFQGPAQNLEVQPPSSSTPIPSLTQTYTDSAQHFSFNYPEGYSVREVSGDDTSRVLIIENTSTAALPTEAGGIQIIITPDYPDPSITVETIHEAIPDMKVENPQSFPVGANSGLAFQSDNSAFGGASREVWFVYNGFLYQISTYAESDELLKKIFETWTFFESSIE